MQTTLGIMQGRLSPPEDGRLQSFPRNAWREEFPRARAVGLDAIEWVHDAYGYSANPIFHASTRAEVESLKQRYAVTTPAICADWFMDYPLLRCSARERAQREEHLHALIPVAAGIGASRIVLPFVDGASIRSEDEERSVLAILRRALPIAEENGVALHLETDLDPGRFAAFLALIEHPLLAVNWDSGNSSGHGFVASDEFAAYGQRIGSIHIKDRYRDPSGGVETRPLGHGSANFDDIFQAIQAVDFSGDLTLQAARGVAGDEEAFVRRQIAFLSHYREVSGERCRQQKIS